MQGAFDEEAVKAQVSAAIEAGPRGTRSALARALGVEPQTATKWAKREICPSPERWDGIEVFFGWDAGYLDGVAGLIRSGDLGLASLPDRLAQLEHRVRSLELLIHAGLVDGLSLTADQVALAASGGLPVEMGPEERRPRPDPEPEGP